VNESTNLQAASDMKRILIPLLLLHFLSCERLKDCPEIIKGKSEDHLISDQELSTVKSLFISNNLNYDNFQFNRLQKDDLGHHHVRCFQYVNNLKILSNDLIFHFDAQGHYYTLSGTIISTMDIEPSPSMDISELREIYLKSLEEDDSYFGSKKKIENDCLRCELGYYNLNAGISYTTPDFRLAWKIKPDKSDYPVAVVNDSEKSLIYYDNGIRY
jgi:Zn-dependent metalloprotease